MYRQGDVLIISVENLPENLEPVAREDGRIVLAHGEVTGHHHSLCATKARAYTVPGSPVSIVEVAEALALLEHQEHSTIPLEKGFYEVRLQREYTPEAIRNVAD